MTFVLGEPSDSVAGVADHLGVLDELDVSESVGWTDGPAS